MKLSFINFDMKMTPSKLLTFTVFYEHLRYIEYIGFKSRPKQWGGD